MYFLYNTEDDIATKKIIRGKVTDFKLTQLELKAKSTDVPIYEAMLLDPDIQDLMDLVKKIKVRPRRELHGSKLFEVP